MRAYALMAAGVICILIGAWLTLPHLWQYDVLQGWLVTDQPRSFEQMFWFGVFVLAVLPGVLLFRAGWDRR